MSTNRLTYDTCSYKQSLSQSLAPVGYMLNPIMYEHDSKCRMDKGVVGGTNVSQIRGDQVDLENNLRGQTYPATRCSQYKYSPPSNNVLVSKEYIKPVEHPIIDTTLEHLESCNMFRNIPAQISPEINYDRCR